MAEGKKVRERKKLILEMLKAADGYVYTRDILAECEKRFGKKVVKSVISNNISSLKDEGFDIESGNDGYILRGADDIIESNESDFDGYDEMTGDTVTEWLLLLFFEKEHNRYMNFEDVISGFEEFAEPIGEVSLREHLERLVQQGYIYKQTFAQIQKMAYLDETEEGRTSNKLFYHMTESAPVPALIPHDDLAEFNSCYFDRGYGTELKSTLKDINDKIAALSPEMYGDVSGVIKADGRKNDIPPELMKRLETFFTLPFKEQALSIRYKEKHTQRDFLFKTALIVFSVESNSFYLLGEVKKGKKWHRQNFRLELITAAEADEETVNDIYESSRYKKIFSEMWSVVTDKPVHVEVWFEDVSYVRRQIKELGRARKDTAAVSFPSASEAHGWIKYKDDIIGVNSFMRFVRGMGSSAVIIEPESNREHMIKKTEEIIESYKELHEKWENMQMQ